MARVYGEKIDINTESTKSFYDMRARTVSDREYKYTTVLLGDQNPEFAKMWDKMEKETIIPKLNISNESVVLDIGCGMGRWAEAIIPICKEYVGVDFSEEMIKLSQKEYANKDNVKFVCDSFQHVFDNPEVNYKKYDVIIICGVSMYVNDDELSDCYEKLGSVLMKQNGRLYLEESVAKQKRLTLDDNYSEFLGQNYDAIYRNADEYRDFLAKLYRVTDIIEDEYITALDRDELSETGHWYTILERK